MIFNILRKLFELCRKNHLPIKLLKNWLRFDIGKNMVFCCFALLFPRPLTFSSPSLFHPLLFSSSISLFPFFLLTLNFPAMHPYVVFIFYYNIYYYYFITIFTLFILFIHFRILFSRRISQQELIIQGLAMVMIECIHSDACIPCTTPIPASIARM